MPRPRRSDLSRRSRRATRRRNFVAKSTAEDKELARERSRVSLAELRASRTLEQREAAREAARLASRKRRANARAKLARRNDASVDLNQVAFQYGYTFDYSSHPCIQTCPMEVICNYCGSLNGDTSVLCCCSGNTQRKVQSVKIKSYNKTVSTGNMVRHLREDHKLQDDRVYVSRAKLNSKEAIAAKISDLSSPPRNLPKTCDKWQLAKDVAIWCCRSLIPFDCVSGEAMVDFFKKYEIIFNVEDMPSQQTVKSAALSDIYDSMVIEVKEMISNDGPQHMAMAFDLWTDQYRRLNYITFTLHYLTQDFDLKAFTLRTEIITGKNTAGQIKDVVNDMKTKFGLEGKDIVAVTETGDNLKVAVALANMTHHLCLGHGLNNLITVDGINAVPEIAAVVQKFKSVIKAIRYNAQQFQEPGGKLQRQIEVFDRIDKVVEMLEADESDPVSQVELELQVLKTEDGTGTSDYKQVPAVTTSVPTRWHVMLEMLETVITTLTRETITLMLKKIHQGELKISPCEWALADELMKFLTSFREAVEVLSSQKTCTINVALVFRSEIMDVLNSVKDGESSSILNLKGSMLSNVHKRFPITEQIVAAALLDNRFMSLKDIDLFLENRHTTRVSFLASYIKERISINEIPDMLADNSNTITIKIEPEDLLQKLSKKHSINAYQGMQEDPEQECWKYFAAADPSEPKDGDLLSYWNSRKDVYPYLSALAKSLLCVPATSASCDQIFSELGLTLTTKRSRLSPTRLNEIIFVHDNWKTCKIEEE